MQNLLTFGARHRLITLIILTLVTALCATGLDKLRIDTSFDSLISDNDPTKIAYETIKDEFGSDNTTMIYVRSENLWTEDRIAALEEMHYALEDLPFVQRVESLFNTRSIRDRDGMIESSTVLDGVPFDASEMADAKARALYSPLVVGNFISEDGTVTAINVSIEKDPTDPEFDRHAFEAMNAAIAPYTDAFDESFQVGPPRVNEETTVSLFADFSRLIPLSLGVLIVTIVIFLRNGLACIFPLLTSALSIVFAFGLMGHLGIPINILSAMVPSLVIVIGSTEDTHMLASYLQGLGGGDADAKKSERRRAATFFMVRQLGLPLILTSVTTTLGFSANGFAEMELIRDFSYSASMAIAANAVVTILTIPLLLTIFGPLKSRLHTHNPSSETPEEDLSGIVGAILSVFRRIVEKPKTVIAVSAVLFVVCTAFGFQTKVSNDPIAFFKSDHPLVQNVEQLAEDLSGMEIFYINLDSTEDFAFRQPENLRKLAAIKQYIMADGRFDNAISIADHLSMVNREFHGSDPAMMTVPDTPELVNQYLLFFQRGDLESYISADYERANMVVRHNIHNSHDLKLAVADLTAKVHEIAGPGLRVHLVGQNLMINNAAEDLIAAQVQSVLLLLAVIFIMMSLVYTSVIGGLLSLIPNIIPIAVIFGVMGIFDIPLNPGTATVAVIAIGIAIDDTIHLLSTYAHESRLTPDRMLAIRRTQTHQAIPAISTSVALGAGFLVLMDSNFTIISQFGMLSAIAMIAALVADLIVTPVLMSFVRLVGLDEILMLRVGKSVFENSPLFDGMTPYQMRKTVLLSETQPFKAGDRLVEQGTVGDDMIMILSGQVVVTLDQNGKTTRLAERGPGGILGEIGFVQEQERTANVDAVTDGEMLVFNAERVRRNMLLYPHIASKLNQNIARILGARLAATSQRLGQFEEAGKTS
ncbi:MMPL family transporter [Rhodospirillaceae bacterium KN72]|uniref:MMPL family transporter n=1 Tax=Pacificispira spongiicola TaxID=2729598 RepID=A0A7Y0E017_9PROT|nr:MMPL family transporter [Pacificispira spongiicola]NMM44747.1 MMPL family transporter [Pacificispira spongiicola]